VQSNTVRGKVYLKGERFKEIIDELIALRNKKNSDYASNDDTNGNFKRVAKMAKPLLNPTIPESLHPLVIAMIYELKQTDGVMEMISKNKVSKAESILDKFNDKAVYSVIERMCYEEANNNRDN
jgi:hypothetical protein